VQATTAERFLVAVVACGTVGLVLCPTAFADLGGLSVVGPYFVCVASLFAVPALLFNDSSYSHAPLTRMVWSLRLLGIVQFLIVAFWRGISARDLAAVGGTVGWTFCYEGAYWFYSMRRAGALAGSWVLCSSLALVYALLLMVPSMWAEGWLHALFYHVESMRSHVYYWPNLFAIYMVMLSWMALALAIYRRRAYLWLLGGALAGVFVTASRTALLALGVSVGVAICLNRRRLRPRHVIIMLLLLVLPVYVSLGLKEASPGSTFVRSLLQRSLRWENALEVWRVEPILGSGLRSFTYDVPTFAWAGTTDEMGSAHNDYIDLLVRGGLLYSVAFWSFVAMVVVKALRQRRGLPPFLAYLSFGMVGALFAALYQNTFKDPVFAALFWAYVAAVSYYTHRQSTLGLPPATV